MASSTLPRIISEESALRTVLRKVFSFPVFLGVLLVGALFPGARTSLKDPDTWWHLAVGERILVERTLPTADPYSFTVSGNDWMAYEWLGEVVMASAARWGGLPGLIALLIALSGMLLLLLYYYAYLRSGNVKAAFIACAVLLPAAAISFNLRPQLFGYAFLLVTLIFLERFRQGRQKTLWILPGLFLVWVNVHGTFMFGLWVMGFYWVGGLLSFRWGGLVAEKWTREQRKHLALVFLFSLVALMFTPYGTRVAAYPLELALSQPVNIANIQEWQPLSFGMPVGKLCMGLLFLFFLAQVLSSRLTYRVEELWLLIFAVYAASQHVRFVVLFVLIFAPLLAALLSRWLPPYRSSRDFYVLNGALMVLIGTIIAVFFPSEGELKEVIAKTYPQEAVEYLREHPTHGPTFNEYGWGGYLIWSLSPNHKVFIDGRADIYEYGGVLGDYLRISSLDRDTLTLLRKYGVVACLVEREAPLSTLLAALPEWEQSYADDLSALFVRKGTSWAATPDERVPPGRIFFLADGSPQEGDSFMASQLGKP